MIRRLLRALASRGEMPDPVDAHYLTAAAALTPDSLPDCCCEDCGPKVETQTRGGEVACVLITSQ